MASGLNIKDLASSSYIFQQRVFRIIIIAVLVVIILFGRLFYLQVIQHSYYDTMSSNNSIRLTAIDPPRGLIYDRNNTLLAENMPVYSLEVIPDKVTDIPGTVDRLSKFIALTPEDTKLFYRQIKQKRPFDNVPLKVKLTDEEVAKFYAAQYQFPGVQVAARLIRYYPYKGDMVDFLGYTGRINQKELAKLDPTNYSATNYMGKLGIEAYFESQLHGTVGYKQVETDAAGRALRILNDAPPTPGQDLHLTIDAKLQEVAVQAMNGLNGAVVAIDPRNGQVLVMVSSPSYDPNLFVRGISHPDYQGYRNSPDQPLLNRAVRGIFPPGSTVKPIYALQGLKYDVVTPEFRLFDPGYYQIQGVSHKYRDMHIHGWVDMVRAITVSCDTYFFSLADKMGIAKVDEVLFAFGLGKRTNIEMHEELTGIVPTPDWKRAMRGEPWYRGDTVNVGIGQGMLSVTPLQLAVMTSIIAGRGTHYQPTLVLSTTNPDGSVQPHLPVQLDPAEFPPAVWDTVIQGMVGVIRTDGGTGYRFGRPSYSVAAKTGTAQLFTVAQNQKYYEGSVSKKLRDNSLFIAFAPVDNPTIAVAVTVQNGHAASAVARKVLDYYMLTENAGVPVASTTTAPAVTTPATTVPVPTAATTTAPATVAPAPAAIKTTATTMTAPTPTTTIAAIAPAPAAATTTTAATTATPASPTVPATAAPTTTPPAVTPPAATGVANENR